MGAKLAELTEQMEAIEMRKSAQALRALWVLGNEYLQEAAPWTAISTDPERAAVVVRTALNLVALFARVSAPVIPFAAETIDAGAGRGLSADLAGRGHRAPSCRACRPAARSRAPDVLFRKIEDAQVAEWTERFGGAEAAV